MRSSLNHFVIICLNSFYLTALLLIQAKDDYEREQRRKERRIESGETTWMLPSLSERLAVEDESNEKVDFVLLNSLMVQQ